MAMIASSPLISGICISISVISGRCARNSLTASRPLVASAGNSPIGPWPCAVGKLAGYLKGANSGHSCVSREPHSVNVSVRYLICIHS